MPYKVTIKRRLFTIILLIILIPSIFFIINTLMKKPVEWTAENSMIPVSAPVIQDHGTDESLIKAIDNSMEYLENSDPTSLVKFGKVSYTVQTLKESVLDFKERLKQIGLNKRFFQYIEDNYHFYKSAASEVLFTGYFEAHLHGSREKSETYRYPLYKKPVDLYRIDLSRFYFYQKFKKLPKILRGRLYGDNSIIPYYSREEIDSEQKLAGKDLEIVWVDDPIDLFFLQIQGSGVVELDTGELLRVGYDESNGHPYRAIGKLLIDRSILTYETQSMQAIIKYLRQNTNEMEEIFNYNPSYVFFRVVEKGPLGSLQIPLTPFRSIATDYTLFPKGVLTYIETEHPIFDENKTLKEWKKYRGFALNQDTGGAIRGPGRIDLFTGHGEHSELVAGHMKQKGIFYFIVKKSTN